jgi:hypothetical protein
MGTYHVKKLAIAVALCGSLVCSPVHAKTFVGVLWPMFGPLPAIGLVELVAELKTMPDVEVETYVHQAWPSLVDDLDRQPPGTHTVVIGYSLGANSSVFVANNAKHVDLIVALQPSMLSWNPPLTPGKVGRMIEIYNPNPWMTFGGMGSKKLVGDNIEYIANNDSHPGAQFSSQFRDLAKSEVAKFAAEDGVETAQAEAPQVDTPAPLEPTQSSASIQPAALTYEQNSLPAEDRPQIAQAAMPKPQAPVKVAAAAQPKQRPAQSSEPAQLEPAAAGLDQSPHHLPVNDHGQIAQTRMQAETPQSPEAAAPVAKPQPSELTAFVAKLLTSANSGDLFAQRRLTAADLKDYAERTYHGSPTAGLTITAAN